MPSPHLPFAKAVAVKSLELVIRFWPDESRHWGQALLAETHEITRPMEALFWALGGFTVFLGSHLSHLLTVLKLPPGRTTAPLPLTSGGGPRFPHNSRLLTALILAAVALLLLLPPGREATSIVSSSWNGFEATARDSRTIDKLAARADQHRNARMLAFAAIAHPDPQRGSALADRAVSLDPGLVWIYASRFRRPDDTPTNKEWLGRLRSSDPDNAFVYLLSSEEVIDPQVRSWIETAYRGTDKRADTALRESPWAKCMDSAFQAPRYDSYLKRHLDLTREGWRRAPEVPPSLVAYSVWSHQIPNLMQILLYADLRLRDARTAAAAGQASDAAEIANQVVAFGRRMTAGSESDIERLMALEITRRGLVELSGLYSQNGREREADVTTAQVRELKMRLDHQLTADRQATAQTLEDSRRKALWVQLSAIATLFVVFPTAMALLWLELSSRFTWCAAGKLRRLTCIVSDWGPVTLLLAATTFLVSFRPFALALERYRAIDSPSAQEFFNWQLWALAGRNPFRFLVEPSFQTTRWLLLTMVLSAVAIYVSVRGWRNRRAAD